MLELIVTPICFFVDQYTKNIAEKRLEGKEKEKILNGKIHLQIIYNKGAFLGFLKNHKALLIIINLISIFLLICSMIALFFVKGYHLIKLGISLITGGALGNIYDRMRKGKVVDFFAFSFKPNIYFNLADIFVFLGGFLIILGGGFYDK